MLAEFYGEMAACDEELRLPWGPRVLIVQQPASPGQRGQARAEILAVCAAIQQRRGDVGNPSPENGEGSPPPGGENR